MARLYSGPMPDKYSVEVIPSVFITQVGETSVYYPEVETRINGMFFSRQRFIYECNDEKEARGIAGAFAEEIMSMEIMTIGSCINDINERFINVIKLR